MANQTLGQAKAAKNDEFYTQYADIEREMQAYLEYNPDVFRDKTILLPCDDPEWSNFTRYFAQNFQTFGLRKLISTSYAQESKRYQYGYQLSLFESESPKYDPDKTMTHGKIFILDRDVNNDGHVDVNDLQWDYLEGDGDFRSKEVRALRDQSDFIITNPPFSLFREFIEWIGERAFSVIGNKNAITYKEIFPRIKDNNMWSGSMSFSKDMLFIPPKDYSFETKVSGSAFREIDDVKYLRSPAIWFTNIEHGRRHEPLPLMTMAGNIKYSKHKEIKGRGYQHYDNYDAIEVPYTDAIPSDYDGVMGVPISFLDKYCPEQFEIVNPGDFHKQEKIPALMAPGADGWHINGVKRYARVFIRKIQTQ